MTTGRQGSSASIQGGGMSDTCEVVVVEHDELRRVTGSGPCGQKATHRMCGDAYTWLSCTEHAMPLHSVSKTVGAMVTVEALEGAQDG